MGEFTATVGKKGGWKLEGMLMFLTAARASYPYLSYTERILVHLPPPLLNFLRTASENTTFPSPSHPLNPTSPPPNPLPTPSSPRRVGP